MEGALTLVAAAVFLLNLVWSPFFSTATSTAHQLHPQCLQC